MFFLRFSKSFDFAKIIRALACLAILWYHADPELFVPTVRGTFSLIYGLNTWGGIFVFIFYLLSGYGIGYGFFSKKYTLSFRSLKTFFVKRFIRIAPAYYLVIAVCYLFIYNGIVPFKWNILLRYLTFTANNNNYYTLPFGGTHAIVSTEMQFYLVAPLLFLVLRFFTKRVSPVLVGIGILAFTFLIKVYLASFGFLNDGVTYYQNIYGMVWGNLDLFLFGMFLSYIAIHHEKSILMLKKHIPTLLYVSIFIIWLWWANWSNSYFIRFEQWPILIAQRYYILPVSICLVIGWGILAYSAKGTASSLQDKRTKDSLLLFISPKTFLYGVASFSYGIYLWHYPILFLLFYRYGDFVYTWPMFFLRFGMITLISIILSLLSYVAIERPLFRLISHKK